MGKVLDPYCGFTYQQEFSSDKEEKFNTGLQFHNLPRPIANADARPPFGLPRGITQGAVPATLTIKSVMPGSPAQQAGLRPGDSIFRIDNRPCNELNWLQVFSIFFPDSVGAGGADLLRGHRVNYRRPGLDQTRDIDLSLRTYTEETVFGISRDVNNAWNHVISRHDKLYYIRIGPISLSTPEYLQNCAGRNAAK